MTVQRLILSRRLLMEEVLRGRKSDQPILIGGGWADRSATDTEVENDSSVWYCWTIRRSVVTIRQWQPVESLERTREHSASSRVSRCRKANAELTHAFEGECEHDTT